MKDVSDGVTLHVGKVIVVGNDEADSAAADFDWPNPDRIGYWWRMARDAAGVDAKWRLHDLRHWSALAAISAGNDVQTVADRLGHTNER